MQKELVCCISPNSWDALRDLAGIPRVHKRQSAAGLSDWIVDLIIQNEPASWHDERPDWLKASELSEYVLRTSNTKFWAMPKPGEYRQRRHLFLPSSILPDLYPIANTLNLFPVQFSPSAILGLLLEALGSGWLKVDHYPETPDTVNLDARQHLLEKYGRDDQNSLLRVERHTAQWQTNHQTH